jgi:hypothetical protein
MSAAAGGTTQSAPDDAGQTPAQTVSALGEVVSAVTGRTRLRLKPELRTPEAMATIQDQLNSHEQVGDVSVNPRTGSVVITHAKGHRAEQILHDAFKESEFVAAAVFELPDDGDEGGGDRFSKLDQQLADLVYRVDMVVYRKTGLRFRGQILAGSIAGVGIAQIALFGISLEMLPGPLLLWIAWDIYHRVSKESSFPARPDAASNAPEPGGEAIAPATQSPPTRETGATLASAT